MIRCRIPYRQSDKHAALAACTIQHQLPDIAHRYWYVQEVMVLPAPPPPPPDTGAVLSASNETWCDQK